MNYHLILYMYGECIDEKKGTSDEGFFIDTIMKYVANNKTWTITDLQYHAPKDNMSASAINDEFEIVVHRK